MIDPLDALNVCSWPRKYRRIFVLTFPISGPLWVVAFGLTMIAVLLAIVVLIPIMGILNLWEGDELTRWAEKREHDIDMEKEK